MGYRDSYSEEDEEVPEEHDLPDASDADDDDEPATVPCPYCRGEMSEDSPRCPHCGNYISEEDAPRRKPAWIVVTAVAVLAAMALALLAWVR